MGPKCARILRYPRVPGSTTWRARRSASMIGRECGGWERRRETVDLPVAMEPVRPMRSIPWGGWVWWDVGGFRVGVVGMVLSWR